MQAIEECTHEILMVHSDQHAYDKDASKGLTILLIQLLLLLLRSTVYSGTVLLYLTTSRLRGESNKQ